jgi:hypothetical protein
MQCAVYVDLDMLKTAKMAQSVEPLLPLQKRIAYEEGATQRRRVRRLCRLGETLWIFLEKWTQSHFKL